MQEQFLLIADELGWGLETQIERLDARGAFSHYLHGQMQRAGEAVAPGASAEPTRSFPSTRTGEAQGLRTAIRRWVTARGRGPSRTVAS